MSTAQRILAAAVLVGAGVGVDRLALETSSTTVHALYAPSAPSASDAASVDAFNRVAPAVVQVISVGIGSGSGVIYDHNGDIVTNNHVVAGATHLRVNLSDGRSVNATLVGTDPADDLAVIRIHAGNLPVATFGNSSTLHPAQTVLAIGNPLGLQQTVTSGVVSAVGRTVDEPGPNGGPGGGAYLPDAIQTSAPINPGNSGGALVALDGTVVGIPTLVVADTGQGTAAQGIGFAISSARVKDVAPQLIKYGKVLHTGRAFLGVGLQDTQANGAQVVNLASGGPASHAGVRAGDVIVAIDGHTVTSSDDARAVLAKHRPGDKVTLTVNRNGQNVQVRVTLGELPASQ